MPHKDISGQSFNSWTLVKYLGAERHNGKPSGRVTGQQIYLVRCKCGRQFKRQLGNIKNGNSTQCKSCQCKAAKTKHGLSGSFVVNLHKRIMRSGDALCDRWRDIKLFAEDVMVIPRNKRDTFYRIDPLKPWQPGNVTFDKKHAKGPEELIALVKAAQTQHYGKSERKNAFRDALRTAHAQGLTYARLSRICGISRERIRQLIDEEYNSKMRHRKRSPRKIATVVVDGVTHTITSLAALAGVSSECMRNRVAKEPHDALLLRPKSVHRNKAAMLDFQS